MAWDEAGTNRLSSSDLTGALVAMKDRPWADWSRGRALNETGLARLLKGFGLAPKKLRIGDQTVRGYDRGPFEDVFRRYLGGPVPCPVPANVPSLFHVENAHLSAPELNCSGCSTFGGGTGLCEGEEGAQP